MLGVMTARAGRPVSVTLAVVGILGMAVVELLAGWSLRLLAEFDTVVEGRPPPVAYLIVGAVLAVSFSAVAVLLWRGALSQRAVTFWALVIPMVFAAPVAWVGQVRPSWLAVAVVFVAVAWALAWIVLRQPGTVAWLRREPSSSDRQ